MKNFIWAIKKCFVCSYISSLLLVLIYVGNGVLYPLMVEVIANVINNIDKYMVSYWSLLFIVLLLGAAYTYSNLSVVLSQFLVNKINLCLKMTYCRELLDKRTHLSISDMELEENYNMIELVTQKAEEYLSGILLNCCIVLSFGIEVIGLLRIISTFSIWLILFFVFLTVPLSILSFMGGKAVFREDKGIVKLTRLMNYYSEVLCDKQYIDERSLFSFSKFINKKFEDIHIKRSNKNTLVLAKWTVRIKICAIILLSFSVLVVVSMINCVIKGQVSIGLFITLSGTLISLSKRISQSFSKLIFSIAGQNEYMDELNKFLSMQEKEKYTNYVYEEGTFCSLKVSNLSFRYPGSEKYILRNLNLLIEKGKSYSLIGVNGAGKSTLIKILTGIYKDYEGTILLNGKNLQEYSDNQLRNIFALVNQDYAKYEVSLKDNMVFGHEELWNESILEQIDLYDKVVTLKERENTHLGKLEKDGVDLSGGEWQKIVIGRALLRKTPVIIMDEPTASLSPRMENRFYTNVVEAKKDSTLLLISHRMAATKVTDKIILIDNGNVIEEGSHEELMAIEGFYYSMYDAQRRSYDDTKKT